MSYRVITAIGAMLIAIHTPVFTAGAAQPLPIRNARPIVAAVNSDVIALDELMRQLDSTAVRARLQQGRATVQQLDILDRLITVKLLAQEARRMGLDSAPEIKKDVEVTSREILREVLLERVTKNVQPDPSVVEKRYRDAVRQWKTTSLLFQDQAAATKAQKDLSSGAAFTEVASRAVAAKTAKLENDDGYHPRKDYLPQIAEALSKLQVGQASPVVRLQAGFVVFKLLDVRYPEDKQAREEARKTALADKKSVVVKAHDDRLRKQLATIDSALLKSIDYEAPRPGVEALRKDQRVLVRIKGGEPITVADLTDYLRLQFFHGGEDTKQQKRMNEKKEEALNATLGRRLLNLEAKTLGIDKTNEYRDRVNGYRESVVFNAFVQKVVAPDNKMHEEEVKGYYGVHLKEYSYPTMLKLRSLAFARRPSAEDAMRKLREGAAYAWVEANAEGQVARGAADLLTFDGQPVMTDSMPDALQKALAGCKPGELRLYASPEGRFYVLSVQEVISKGARPYDEVRQDIAQKLYGDKLKKAVETYATKLRAQSKVATYLTKVQ